MAAGTRRGEQAAREGARLGVPDGYLVTDPATDAGLDNLTALAAQVCGTPKALMTLVTTVDGTPQLLRAGCGVATGGILRDDPLGGRVLRTASPLVVRDAALDPSFADSPLVTDEPRARFYAGVPLTTGQGHVLGALCVLDTLPRDLSSTQLQMLSRLAQQAMFLLEAARTAHHLAAEAAQHRVAAERFARDQQVLDGILRHTDVLFYAKDLEGRYLLSNDAHAALTGIEPGQVAGLTDFDLFTPSLAEQLQANDRLVAATGERRTFAESAADPQGRLRYYLSTKFPLLDHEGRPYAVAGVSTDVTALAAARQTLAESEQRWRALVEHSPVAVAVYALDDLSFLYLNPQASRLYGVADAGELVGRPYTDVIPEDRAQAYQENVDRLRAGESLRAKESRIRRLDGVEREVEINAVAVTYDGRPAVQVELRDVSERVAADVALRASEARFRSMFTGAPFGVAEFEPDGTFVSANPRFCDMLGYDADELVGRHVSLITDPADRDRQAQQIAGLAEQSDGYTTQRVFLHKDGRKVPVLVSVCVVNFGDGRPERPIGMAVDISQQLAAEDALRVALANEKQTQAELRSSAAFNDAVLAASPDLIFVIDLDTGRNVYASRNLVELLGHTEEELANLGGGALSSLVHPDDVERLRAANAAARDLDDAAVLQLRYRALHADGEYRWLARRVTPFARDMHGRVVQILGVARDITDIVEVEHRLEQAALRDPLTGLANRTLLADRLRQALTRAHRTGYDLAVLFLDLDGFKHINDTGGHAAGDHVLVVTAERLAAALRPEDSVARVGGDEFVVLVEPALRREDRRGPDGGDLHADALSVAARIKAALDEPIVYDDTQYVVTASIGVSFATAMSDPDEVLRDADIAMYRAKSRGKNRHHVFDGTLRTAAVERGRVERTLRSAVQALPDIGIPARSESAGPDDGPALEVAYQPIFALDSGALASVEALARLTDADGEPILPDVFIPVAEETGLIAPLGRHVLDQACEDLARWHAAHPGYAGLGLAVNLSARQAGLTDLVEQVKQALSRNGVPPQRLTLELTETVLLEAGRSTLSVVTALHQLGVAISIDDFGTGFASLRYLAQLPVHSVKVDRSFTAGLPDDATCATIVRAITGLARDLGLACVVEGIETQDQLEALPPGVHGQGFLLGPPVSADGVDALLAGRGAR